MAIQVDDNQTKADLEAIFNKAALKKEEFELVVINSIEENDKIQNKFFSLYVKDLAVYKNVITKWSSSKKADFLCFLFLCQNLLLEVTKRLLG